MPKNKRKIINDPVFGFINIPSEFLYDLIQHPYMQRLTRIRQLGMSSFVYPGTQHTRFQHSLGAMYLMNEAISQLRLLGYEIGKEDGEGALAAILLHDVGHAPFSHVLENSLVSGISHEEISLLMIEHINKETGGRLDNALKIFHGTHQHHYLHQLVSSQLDVDRLDYLRRDSFYSGVTEGTIGSDRIIKMMDLYKGHLVIQEKGIYSIEKFLMARRLMYWQVYLHKTSIAAEKLMIHALSRAKELAMQGQQLFASPALSFFLYNAISKNDFRQRPEVLEQYAMLDDSDILSAFKVWMSHPDKVLSALSNGFINRRLFKVKILEAPLTKQECDELNAQYKEHFDICDRDAAYFWAVEEVSNEAYNPNDDAILIKYNNGEVKDITQASDMFNLEVLGKEVKKYYLCYWPVNN
jgi:HD superfamily phosphohydrolase